MPVPDGLTDEDLIARVARGDRDAFAALYRRRRADVYRFALHVSGSRTAAEDVTHDVFLVLIDEAARYTPGRSTVVAWLLGIARNHVRRWLARSRYTVSLSDERAASVARTPTSNPDPHDELSAEQDVAAVRRALMELPVKYREVIVLCDMRETSYADAAQVIGCAIGTIRSRLHRGRALLAARLRSSGHDTLFQVSVTRVNV